MKFTTLLLVLGSLGLTAGASALFRSGSPTESEAQATYYADGSPEARTETRDGLRHGLCERWGPDGGKIAEGRFEKGRMEGDWSFWNGDGSLDAKRSGAYVNGQKLTD